MDSVKEQPPNPESAQLLHPGPVCSESFSADIDQVNFDAHILSHVQKICPICHNLIEEVDDNGFQFHVNQHLDKDQH